MAFVAFSGPVPKNGETYCSICAMTWKQEGLAALDAQVQAAIRSGLPLVRLDLEKAPHLMRVPELAVAWAIFQPLGPPPAGGNGMMPLPVPLCWTHMMGLMLKEGGGVVPATAGDVAALSGGRPVPLVGQGR